MLSNILLRQSRPLLLLPTLHRSRSSSIMTNSIAKGPVSEAIAEKLSAAFSPAHLEVRNESHMHNV